MAKKELFKEDLINWWLEKYHGTTLEKIIEDNPDRVTSKDSQWFYSTYTVTQEQYNEWYEWALNTTAKYFRVNKDYVKKAFFWLDVAPSIVEKSS